MDKNNGFGNLNSKGNMENESKTMNPKVIWLRNEFEKRKGYFGEYLKSWKCPIKNVF